MEGQLRVDFVRVEVVEQELGEEHSPGEWLC